MPGNPPAIFTPPAVPSPSAPGAVHAVPSPNPATPAVIHAPPMAGGQSGLNITGSISWYGEFPVTFPFLPEAGVLNGKPYYELMETGVVGIAPNDFIDWICYFDGTYWILDGVTHDGEGVAYAVSWRSSTTAASPDLATWVPQGDSMGTPIVNVSSGLTTPPAIHTPPTRTPGNPPAITP